MSAIWNVKKWLWVLEGYDSNIKLRIVACLRKIIVIQAEAYGIIEIKSWKDDKIWNLFIVDFKRYLIALKKTKQRIALKSYVLKERNTLFISRKDTQ